MPNTKDKEIERKNPEDEKWKTAFIYPDKMSVGRVVDGEIVEEIIATSNKLIK